MMIIFVPFLEPLALMFGKEEKDFFVFGGYRYYIYINKKFQSFAGFCNNLIGFKKKKIQRKLILLPHKTSKWIYFIYKKIAAIRIAALPSSG